MFAQWASKNEHPSLDVEERAAESVIAFHFVLTKYKHGIKAYWVVIEPMAKLQG